MSTQPRDDRLCVAGVLPSRRIDTFGTNPFHVAMKVFAFTCALVLLGAASNVFARGPGQADEFRQLARVEPLPVALDREFSFRKTKLLLVGDLPGPKQVGFLAPGKVDSPIIKAETAYRLFGAVTELDRRRRYGHYFDFFWRARKAVPVTVRLEYRQQKLRSFTQARELTYPNGKGSHKTAFAVIGDDFFNDGRVISWRCLLIVDGRIVAEDRSYLWRN